MKYENWNGFKCASFVSDGCDGLVVFPDTPRPGNPWVWRTEFFDQYDLAERMLLREGYFRAYVKVSDMYGAPPAISKMKRFYEYIRSEFGLAEKTVLYGISRGGLYACNYAYAYPGDVRAIVLDAPVLNICSWPGGLYATETRPPCWEQCKSIYGLTDETAYEFCENPVDRAATLAKSGIPIFLTGGLADKSVAWFENSAVFIERFRLAGGNIDVLIEPRRGHHPHNAGAAYATQVFEWILDHSSYLLR